MAEGFFCEEALETLEEIPEPYREDERVAGAHSAARLLKIHTLLISKLPNCLIRQRKQRRRERFFPPPTLIL